VRVTPKASRTGVTGLAADADGRAYVKLRVTAPAQDGKANRALLKLLAKEWQIARSSLHITAGKKDRIKSILVAGNPPVLLEKLERWIGDLRHA
jgi:uncharacterized protein (TIGR00251 family)